jgi:KipI family sensor histidine kinase inhibitor
MNVLPSGPRAVLVEFESLADVMAAAAGWRVAPPAGAVEIVPAARTILVVHDGSLDPASLSVDSAAPAAAPSSRVLIDVDYDGPDLTEIAGRCGLPVDEVVRLHAAAEYTVAFCGFMPGFAYMVGLPMALHLPRRQTPRTRVPAGAVAIAAEFAGVYPRESPGGWHVLGHTDAVLWSEAREPAALLAPGTRVRFRPR